MELAIDAVEIEYINLNIGQKIELNLTLLRAKIFDYLMPGKRSGGGLNIKMSSYQYRDPHVKDKTVSPTVLSLTWESPYLEKTVFILRRGPDGWNYYTNSTRTKPIRGRHWSQWFGWVGFKK